VDSLRKGYSCFLISTFSAVDVDHGLFCLGGEDVRVTDGYTAGSARALLVTMTKCALRLEFMEEYAYILE
jgi:hypothetical protein